jgi:predicted RNase H-like nuclease (RuvC/YqgF family)
MNKKLLVLLVVTSGVGIQIQAHGGGGGGWGSFGGGLATGVILTSAVNSGNRNDRDPAYWDYKRDRENQRVADRDIRKQQQEIKKTERKIERAKTDSERSNYQKTLDMQNKRLSELQDRRDDLG